VIPPLPLRVETTAARERGCASRSGIATPRGLAFLTTTLTSLVHVLDHHCRFVKLAPSMTAPRPPERRPGGPRCRSQMLATRRERRSRQGRASRRSPPLPAAVIAGFWPKGARQKRLRPIRRHSPPHGLAVRRKPGERVEAGLKGKTRFVRCRADHIAPKARSTGWAAVAPGARAATLRPKPRRLTNPGTSTTCLIIARRRSHRQSRRRHAHVPGKLRA
jgi:hypothetical protein